MVVEAIRERRFFVLTHPDDALLAVERRVEWMRTGNPPAVREPGKAPGPGSVEVSGVGAR
jgi:hypothetical protein